MTAAQARKVRAPKLELDEVLPSHIRRMSGNTMSVPCVGAIVLVAIMALDQR